MTIQHLFELSREFLEIKNQSFRRYFIRENRLSERLAILKGQRGVGKTTLLVQYLLDFVEGDRLSQKILYVQSDHFALSGMALYEVAEEFGKMGGELIAFDEIHKYPSWSMELKSIYDTFPKLQVIASGSSALEIQRGSHDLSRRGIVYRLPGLSFREFLNLTCDSEWPSSSLDQILHNHEKISRVILERVEEKGHRILPLFQEYLSIGYYPYFNELKNEKKFKITLEQNVHTTLEADLTAIYPHLSAVSIEKIKRLLIYLSHQVPFTPNWHQMKTTLEIGDERTLKTYFKYLEDAELVFSLFKSSSKFTVYLGNPNLRQALCTEQVNRATQREIIFLNMLSHHHQVSLSVQGDFFVDDQHLFEIKGFKQVSHEGYVAADDIEHGIGKKIPLWLFGFLY